MRSSAVLSIAAALAAGAASPARAGDRNELSFGSWNRALRSPSANAVTSDNLGGGGVAYARRLDLRPAPRLSLWATGDFTGGAVSGRMFQTLGTDVSVLAFTAGARAKYRLHRWLAATARLDAGAARTSLQLEDAMGHTAADARWGVTGTAAVGLELLSASSARLSLGIRAELGYTAAFAPALTAAPGGGSEDDDAILLPMAEARLGHLDLGGRSFALSFVGRF